MIDEISPCTLSLPARALLICSSRRTAYRTKHYLHDVSVCTNGAVKEENLIQTKELLDERLVFGSYPEVVTLPTLSEKKQYLFELINTYLLKDILAFENIRNPQKLKDLLVLLAYQIGCEVSLDELGRQLMLSKNTVERYLDLLSKVFVVYNRRGYSKNLRKGSSQK